VPRRVGVAGGARKFRAIRAAVRGGWVSVLITDLQVARRLAAPEALATL
jgi:DNA-binding transcriptional regulator LsrR (DeoR family)